jgi:23S rRNA pseudouridine2605 synthase
LELTIHEGRNRIVRRMLEAVGHPVLELERTRLGPIELGRLAQGGSRKLRPGEVLKLRELVGRPLQELRGA